MYTGAAKMSNSPSSSERMCSVLIFVISATWCTVSFCCSRAWRSCSATQDIGETTNGFAQVFAMTEKAAAGIALDKPGRRRAWRQGGTGGKRQVWQNPGRRVAQTDGGGFQ